MPVGMCIGVLINAQNRKKAKENEETKQESFTTCVYGGIAMACCLDTLGQYRIGSK